MISQENNIEFDFFMDEDVRARKIGILCMEKRLTPALTQALFRVRERALSFHVQQPDFSILKKQLREIKWSKLNLIRSFIAQEFVQHFFQYWNKGPLPILFFNAPFVQSHLASINAFFEYLKNADLSVFRNLRHSQSVFFLDSFCTPAGFKFEEKVRNINNLSRVYRIDSRVHDLMQLTDLLLGITVYISTKKETSSRAKLRLVNKFLEFQEKYSKNKQPFQAVYYV